MKSERVKVILEELSALQRLELILIPATVLFGQILMIFLTLTIIGEEAWIIIALPVLMGFGLSLFIGFLIDLKNPVSKFNHLEILFRIIVIIGGLLLVPILIMQLLEVIEGFILLSILAFFFSTVGGIMIFLCLLLLWRSRPIQ